MLCFSQHPEASIVGNNSFEIIVLEFWSVESHLLGLSLQRSSWKIGVSVAPTIFSRTLRWRHSSIRCSLGRHADHFTRRIAWECSGWRPAWYHFHLHYQSVPQSWQTRLNYPKLCYQSGYSFHRTRRRLPHYQVWRHGAPAMALSRTVSCKTATICSCQLISEFALANVAGKSVPTHCVSPLWISSLHSAA